MTDTERLQAFGRFLRQTFGHDGGDRVQRHVLALDLNDLWRWAFAHPETVTGPHLEGISTTDTLCAGSGGSAP